MSQNCNSNLKPGPKDAENEKQQDEKQQTGTQKCPNVSSGQKNVDFHRKSLE